MSVRKYAQSQIDELVNILKNDGVISVPTDTVYGICAKINSKKAYEKLVEIKNRPSSKKFPIMCADEEQISNIAKVNEYSKKIIQKFMPGPITLILEKKGNVNVEGNTIAIRMATSDAIKCLIQKLGCPIYMTSANKSGEAPCVNLEEVEKALPELDGMLEGKIFYNKASTIVDCTSNEIKILREGPITLEQIREQIFK